MAEQRPQSTQRPIPPPVADCISKHVGDNELCTGEELRTMAIAAHDKVWNTFFQQVLVPHAANGNIIGSYNGHLRHFGSLNGISDRDFMATCERTGVQATKSNNFWTLTW